MAFTRQWNRIIYPANHRYCTAGGPGRHRVVVTGMGLITCLGTGLQHVWKRILAGECGISALQDSAYDTIPCRVAGKVPIGKKAGELDLDKVISKSEQKRMSMASCYAIVAAEEALQHANWKPESEEQRKYTGVAVGVGIDGLQDIADTGRALQDQGYSRVSPYFVPKILVNMPAGNVSLKFGLKGVNHAVSTACTTGVHAIGDASRFIQYGDAKVMVCGGADAIICPLSIAGFCRLRALSTNFNDKPSEASRPFDQNRNGFVMAEGSGILILEEYEHAKERGAKMYAEILGYGLSGDAHHITAPSEHGDGAYRCMKASLKHAGVDPGQVGYINAHATSTPLGDAAESKAITRLTGNHRTKVKVSSTKGAVGHLLGAAGSVEAIFTIMACHTGIVPPTLNCHNPDEEFDLDYVPLKAVQWNTNGPRIALTNSFGFGGTNATLCISSISES